MSFAGIVLAIVLFFAFGIVLVWTALKGGIKQLTGQTDALAPDADDESLLDRSFKRKKAVIVAIDRWADGDTLGGCDRDGANMLSLVCARFEVPVQHSIILEEYWKNETGYYKRFVGADYDIRVVRNKRATAAFTRKLIAWLFAGVSAGDTRLLYWSGHGTQVASTTEKDGLDECLVPYDFDWDKTSTHIIDDIVYGATLDVPEGANCTIILDTCHSADFLRSSKKLAVARFKKPPVWVTSGRSVKNTATRTTALTHDSLLLLSGCKADSVSYTGTFPDGDGNKVQEGALTHAFLEFGGMTDYMTLREIYHSVYIELSTNKNKQEPQLQGAERLKEKPFLQP